ncbi:MAG: YdcF family protein [Acidobacteriota bacterium]
MKKFRTHILLFIFIISLLLLTDIFLLFLKPLDTGVELEKNYGDLILVLGGGLKKINEIGLSTSERLKMAIKLYRVKKRKILVSDGSLYKKSPAIKLIKGFLLDMGIKEEDIIMEGASQTTFENFIYTKDMIKNGKFREIIVCTSPYHHARSEKMIKYLKLKNYKVAKMDDSEIYDSPGLKQKLRNLKLITREYFGLIKFKIFKK